MWTSASSALEERILKNGYGFPGARHPSNCASDCRHLCKHRSTIPRKNLAQSVEVRFYFPVGEILKVSVRIKAPSGASGRVKYSTVIRYFWSLSVSSNKRCVLVRRIFPICWPNPSLVNGSIKCPLAFKKS